MTTKTNELKLTFYKINPFYGLVSLKRVDRSEPRDFAAFVLFSIIYQRGFLCVKNSI